MGARKLYEERIIELIQNLPEEYLPKVVSMVENLQVQQGKDLHQLIKEGRGKYKGILSSTEDFIANKAKEKKLDR